MILAMATEAIPVTTDMLYLIGTVAAGTATVVIFMMRGFSENRRLFYRIISLHNKEDDDRFQALSDDIWDIRLRNAAKDGEAPPPRKTMPRRRYLAEAVDDGAGMQINGSEIA